MYIDSYNRAQISINPTNYKITPPHLVFERYANWQPPWVQVTGSELVGLIPKAALLNAGKYLQRMGESTGIPEKMIMETAIQSMAWRNWRLRSGQEGDRICHRRQDSLASMRVDAFADLLSTDSLLPVVACSPAPFSGALSAMVANLTMDKKGLRTGAGQGA